MKSVSNSVAGDSGRKAERQYDNIVKSDFLHNAACFLGFEFGWGLGLSFAMFSTIVPVYMAQLKAPKSLIGFISSLIITMCPFQVLISHMFRSGSRKKWLTFSYISCVIPWLIYNIVFLAAPGFISTRLQLAFFCLAMILLMAGCVGNSSVYFSLMTDCTPLKKRGSLYGYRVVALFLGIILTAPLSHLVMKQWPEAKNFLVAFIFGNAFYIFSATTFLFVREHRNPKTMMNNNVERQDNFLVMAKKILRKMLKNPNYRVFLLCIILFFVAQITGSFIVVYAKETLALKASQVLTFSIMQVTMGAAASIVLGKIADRTGFKIIGGILSLLLACGFIIFIIISHLRLTSAAAIYFGFFFYAAMVTVSNMVMMNLAAELMPKQSTATIIALTNLLIMPAVLIAIPLCGLIIDLTGGYLIVFVIGAAFAFISGIGFLTLIREPRTRRLYLVKYLQRP